MVLLDDIIEILGLPDLDRDFSFRIQLVKCSLVGATLVHCHRVRHSVVPHGFLEEAPGPRGITSGSQQKVDRLALLVYYPLQILPGAADLDVCLIHPPASTNGMLVLSKGFFQQRQKPDRPEAGFPPKEGNTRCMKRTNEFVPRTDRCQQS